jgi:hypothetical protein
MLFCPVNVLFRKEGIGGFTGIRVSIKAINR